MGPNDALRKWIQSVLNFESYANLLTWRFRLRVAPHFRNANSVMENCWVLECSGRILTYYPFTYGLFVAIPSLCNIYGYGFCFYLWGCRGIVARVPPLILTRPRPAIFIICGLNTWIGVILSTYLNGELGNIFPRVALHHCTKYIHCPWLNLVILFDPIRIFDGIYLQLHNVHVLEVRVLSPTGLCVTVLQYDLEDIIFQKI